jgi:hypothetical protein
MEKNGAFSRKYSITYKAGTARQKIEILDKPDKRNCESAKFR